MPACWLFCALHLSLALILAVNTCIITAAATLQELEAKCTHKVDEMSPGVLNPLDEPCEAPCRPSAADTKPVLCHQDRNPTVRGQGWLPPAQGHMCLSGVCCAAPRCLLCLAAQCVCGAAQA